MRRSSAAASLRLLSEGTPPSIALGNGVSFPIVPLVPRSLWGYGTVLLGAWLLKRRDWFRLKLLAFTLPLTVTALLRVLGGRNRPTTASRTWSPWRSWARAPGSGWSQVA